MSKIGLVLGSFDPPHLGHTVLIIEALIRGMDKVIVIPCYQNPWKEKSSDFDHRYNMCLLEFSEYSSFVKVSYMDKFIKSKYTVDYLRLAKIYHDKDELYIVGGTDIANQIKSWKDSKWILKNFRILKIYRPGYDNVNWIMKLYYKIKKKCFTGIECSSTKIRQALRESKYTGNPYISKETLNYIKTNKLYL